MGNKANLAAQYANKSEPYVYGTGAVLTLAEYYANLLKDANKIDLSENANLYFHPIWNSFEFVNTAANAVKDLQNDDKFSGYLGCVSSAQLATGTLLGLLKAHTALNLGLSATTGAMLSMGSLAMTMYFNAAIASYKSYSLTQEIEQLRGQDADDFRQDIQNRIWKRNPHLAKSPLSNTQMVGILEVEQKHQQNVAKIWAACGVALSLVTYTLHQSCPIEVKIVAGLVLAFTMAMRLTIHSRDEKDTLYQISRIEDGTVPVDHLIVNDYNKISYRPQGQIQGYGSLIHKPNEGKQGSFISPT